MKRVFQEAQNTTDLLDVFALTFKAYDIHFSKTIPRQKKF